MGQDPPARTDGHEAWRGIAFRPGVRLLHFGTSQSLAIEPMRLPGTTRANGKRQLLLAVNEIRASIDRHPELLDRVA